MLQKYINILKTPLIANCYIAFASSKAL